jgi:hypothetical protein
MPQTVISGKQVKDSSIQRIDLDTTTVGQAVVTKLIQGTNVTLSSTGADAGTGDVTISAAVADWNTMVNKPATFPPSLHAASHTPAPAAFEVAEEVLDLVSPIERLERLERRIAELEARLI